MIGCQAAQQPPSLDVLMHAWLSHRNFTSATIPSFNFLCLRPAQAKASRLSLCWASPCHATGGETCSHRRSLSNVATPWFQFGFDGGLGHRGFYIAIIATHIIFLQFSLVAIRRDASERRSRSKPMRRRRRLASLERPGRQRLPQRR
jgi:hypothetical protein